jgi:exopolysaccharide biosynthesis polyprenyl glycosylphosphotransferase
VAGQPHCISVSVLFVLNIHMGSGARFVESARANARLVGLLVDVVTLVLVFVVIYYVCYAIYGHTVFVKDTPMYYEALVLLSWLSALLFAAEYPVRRLTSFHQDLFIVLRVNALALLIFGAASFILKAHSLSRLFIALYLLSIVLCMSLNRIVVRWMLAMLRRSGWDSRTRIIVGDGSLANTYLSKIEEYQGTGIRILGFVGAGIGERQLAAPYLGDISNFRDILAQHPVDGVVVALPITDPAVQQVVEECKLQGVSVEILLDDFSSLINSSRLVYGMGVPRLLISSIPHTNVALVWKRLTDIVISALALIICLPIFAAIAIAIKLDDGGPVFFAQVRVGLRGKKFFMYKFRSMCVDAEQKRKELLHLNEMSGPVFKLKHDPRVTRVGRFIRRTSLDELPQLWNVLKGDMSLVGPRPPLPYEVDQYDYPHRRRLSVKPGLTCLWQISGRNNIDFDRWMDLDMAYIDNWSYLNDLKIIAKTIPAILKRTGAS